MVQEFKVITYNLDPRPIIIYGAGIFGEYTLRALEVHGLQPVCFCDRAKAGKEYLNYAVYDYKIIDKYQRPIVLLAAGALFHEIYQFLLECGVKEVYSVYQLVFEDTVLPMDRLSLQGQDIRYYRELYQFGMEYQEDADKFHMFSLDWVITTKCSLRCRECSNLMQYYKDPQNMKKEQLQSELKKVLEIVDGIMDVRVIGGEPFMHPQMAEIMEPFLDDPQIHNFSIYTNASILPNQKMLSVLKHPKVKCEISDYGEIVKNFSQFVELMHKEGIRHRIVKMDEWHKLGKLADRKSTEEGMRRIFENCYCNDLITLLAGKIYRCPYSANGRLLDAIPYKEEDVVDLNSGTVYYLRYKLRYLLFEKKFDFACGYCSGRNNHLGTVQPAEQAEQPLDYLKYYDVCKEFD